ncbi:uncharacterized protein EDB93DRAFT_1337359 [Suillus bovinus]|uniref:uncharacterized protein n=1 Tax=Suillus bovinus TaxID=48563 RepID=UPI001B878B45|nr:uncharacterized protein EDB93DRAFT_1337359 [Suillus bovinus]KAG2147409.1 hypothetical protein EDB93DRAFT_1337359 [Suillus bovinus]
MYYKSLFPDLPKVPESNIHHFLFDRPEQRAWPDYTLFVNAATGQRRSFMEFVDRVRDGATALGADVVQGGLGLHPENGDLVGILSENSLEYIALVHSLLAITVPFALFSSYSTPHEFEAISSLAQATRIFSSPSLLPLALTSGLPKDRIYILEGERDGYTSYYQLVSSARRNNIPRLPVRYANKDTLAFLVFSSGTSGLPKAVMISHGNIIDTLLGLIPPVWSTPEGLEVRFCILPVYHSYSLYSTCFNIFLQPSTIVMLPKWNINLFFDSVPKYCITTIGLVPSLIHQVVHHPRFETADLSSIKSIGSSAAHLPPQLAAQLCARLPGIERIKEGYGLSEFLTVAMKPLPSMLDGRAKSKPGSVGILFPGVEARILRPDGSLAGPNEAGEIFVRRGHMVLGYKGNIKATQETFVDGWLRTGDRMRIDEDGVLFFEDRIKASLCHLCIIIDDTLKISGMQVSLVEIENTLLAQSDKLVVDVCVAGVSGGRTSDERVPRAWIVLSPAGVALGGKEVVGRLDAWVQERLSRYKWLRGGIACVTTIPKSPTGKVLRRLLVDEYERDEKGCSILKPRVHSEAGKRPDRDLSPSQTYWLTFSELAMNYDSDGRQHLPFRFPNQVQHQQHNTTSYSHISASNSNIATAGLWPSEYRNNWQQASLQLIFNIMVIFGLRIKMVVHYDQFRNGSVLLVLASPASHSFSAIAPQDKDIHLQQGEEVRLNSEPEEEMWASESEPGFDHSGSEEGAGDVEQEERERAMFAAGERKESEERREE